MQDFRKLKVWQKAVALEERIEGLIAVLSVERAPLADQVERAVSSIAANIAEGCGRETKADFKRFIAMAIGSSTELENHLIRTHRLRLLTSEQLAELVDATTEVRKMLHGLRRALG